MFILLTGMIVFTILFFIYIYDTAKELQVMKKSISDSEYKSFNMLGSNAKFVERLGERVDRHEQKLALHDLMDRNVKPIYKVLLSFDPGSHAIRVVHKKAKNKKKHEGVSRIIKQAKAHVRALNE